MKVSAPSMSSQLVVMAMPAGFVDVVAAQARGVPLVLDILGDGDGQRHIVAALLLEALHLEGVVDGVREVPPLVDHAQHAAVDSFGDVFVIGLGEGFGVDDALVEFFVQLAEVCLGGRGGVVVNDVVPSLTMTEPSFG